MYWRLVDESPTWLVSRGRYNRAIAVLEKIKRINGLDDIDPAALVKQEENKEKDEQPTDADDTAPENWLKVLKSRTLLLNLLINCAGW